MQQYWDNAYILYSDDQIERYLRYDSLFNDRSLQEYTDPYDLVSHIVTSLLYDAQINGYLPYLGDNRLHEGVDLGKYQYLVELYEYPSDESEIVMREGLVIDKIKEIQEEDLFGLFAVSILMYLKMIEYQES